MLQPHSCHTERQETDKRPDCCMHHTQPNKHAAFVWLGRSALSNGMDPLDCLSLVYAARLDCLLGEGRSLTVEGFQQGIRDDLILLTLDQRNTV